MALRELVNTLIEVKDDCYRNNNSNQEDVGAQKLDDNIPVQTLHLHLTQHTQ